jgi:hypothetical protein
MTTNERPTPLTDAAKRPITANWNNEGDERRDVVFADFARTLEQMLAERTQERDKAQQDCESYCCTIDMLTDERDTALANVDGLRAALIKINQISNTSDGGRWDEIEKARDFAVAALYPKARRTKVRAPMSDLELIVQAAKLSKCREALDKLHITCETSKPEIYDWYLTDPFASEARDNALETLEETK